jgi:hypothetical protein
MQQLADYRLWVLEEPIGHFIPYKVGTSFSDGEVTTRRLDGRLYFPDMSDDEYHRALGEKKDALNASETMHADALAADGGEEPDVDDAVRQEKIENAQRLRETTDLTLTEIGEAVGRSKSWVSLRTEPTDGD